jgi:hypothetical protein
MWSAKSKDGLTVAVDRIPMMGRASHTIALKERMKDARAR